MSRQDATGIFAACRARIDELLAHKPPWDVVEHAVDSAALDRENKDALWLWARGRRNHIGLRGGSTGPIGHD